MPPTRSGCTVCTVHAESVFRVEGLDCHEEVAVLERRLGRLPGLEALDANVMSQRLRVTYDAARLSTAAITAAVAQTGMRAWLEHDEPIVALPASLLARRLRVVVAAAALLAGAGAVLAGLPAGVRIPAFLAAIAIGGYDVLRRAWGAGRSGVLDINVLMVVAVCGAMLIGEWFEGAAVVVLFSLAQLLEARAMERARGAIRALMELTPLEALVRRAGVERRVPADEVRVGDTIVVRPGEKIPLDGVVSTGESDVNQAPVTGESLPVPKAAGADAFAGTINGRGVLEIRVTHERPDTTLARIIHLVERAQAQRATTQAFVDRFARHYTPAVLVAALVVAIGPPLLAGAAFGEWFYRSLVLLVIACPCALVISTPVSIVSALAGAARRGVLIKGGVHLERAGAVRCIAFDKTGTVTRGHLHVVGVVPLDGRSVEEVLAVAAALESRSEHPVARAIVRHAEAGGIQPAGCAGFQALPGRGAEARVGPDGRPAIIGNHRLFEERGLTTPGIDASVDRMATGGCTAVLVAVDDRPLGIIAVADQPRDTGADVVALLRQQGMARIVLLTGDSDGAARAVAEHLGVDEYRAGLLPEDKVAAVADMRRQYGPVAMIGDGVNDAPALAAADVGIAMGVAGTDAALETADVALMADELLKIPYALRLSRAAVRTIKVNIAFSLVIKGAVLVLAVAGLATLWLAVVADVGASLVVIANGLRLLRVD